MAYNGWMIPDAQRDLLLKAFPPVYENVRCSHITHMVGDEGSKEIPLDADVAVIGYVRGPLAEALIVEVNGVSCRQDGGTYHITISYPEGSSPAAANEMISCFPVTPVARQTMVAHGFICAGIDKPYLVTALSG